MDTLPQFELNNIDFGHFGLVGSVVGALFFVVIKVLLMIDRYNNRLFNIIEEQQDDDQEPEKDNRSWTERNREK